MQDTSLVLCTDRRSRDSPGRLMRHDVAEKRHELLRGVPRRSLAEHLSGLRVDQHVARS